MTMTLRKHRTTWWSEFCDNVREFFFKEEIPYGLAMVRIFLPLAMLIPMVQRIPWVRELYSTDGAVVQLSLIFGYGEMFPVFAGSVAVALYCAMIVFLLMTVIGWHTRISIVAATTLYIYFNWLDTVSTLTKYSAIAADVMVAMCFARSGAVLSVDAWRRRKAGPVSREELKSAVWPTRLVMFLFGAVYFGAAMTKLHTPEFFSGEQLRFWMLSNVNFNNPFGEYLATVPAMLVLCAYITVVWEILFVFVVWHGWTRYLMLVIGAIFHVMTCFTLGLLVFPAICLAGYFAFVREHHAEWLLVKARSFALRMGLMHRAADRAESRIRIPDFLRVPESALFASIVILTCVMAVEAEYQVDTYGERRAEGKFQLNELEPSVAQTMLKSGEPIREVDKFFSFEIGSYMVSGIVADSRREFSFGERIHVQCNLNPPHEDLWLECNLHDADGRLVERNGMIVTRDTLRTNFFYRLSEALEPGRYEFRFVSSGEEVARRGIALESEYTRLAN